MNAILSIREALGSLVANKLRSSLTILGIVIGVAAVIAMTAIGRGATSSVTSSIEGIGTNLISISSGPSAGTPVTDFRSIKQLTLSDAEALANTAAAPAVEAVAPIISSTFTVTYESTDSSTSVTGVTPAYQTVRNATLSEGSFITSEEVSSRALVAVIGSDTAKTLFGSATGAVGKVIRISGQQFHVIGVLTAKGGTTSSSDDVVLIPITTAQTRLMRRMVTGEVDSIQVKATSADTVTQAVQQVTNILSLRHGDKVGSEDFTVRTQAEILSTAQSITGVLTIFLGGIAGISLVVGGIGIMNIMLVSVTERTKEIGLRKALGARQRDILGQFLTESALLGLVGGVIGVVVAWLITTAVQAIAAASSTSITPQFGIDSILLATIFSMAVGVVFGLYPANRAAKLQPVDALRFE